MVPADIYAAVDPVFRAAGVPSYIWMSIAHMETGGTFDPKALGDNGRSFGLFQLFTDGGQGDAYRANPQVLYDPQLNAQVAAPEIARAYRLGQQLGVPEGPEMAAYVANNSGHPGYGLSPSSPFYEAVNIVRNVASTYMEWQPQDAPVAAPPAGAPAVTKSSWLDGFNRFMYGVNPDGSPRTWGEYWGAWGKPWDPDDYPEDEGIIPGDAISRGAKELIPQLAPDTLGNPEWWKTAAVYVTFGLVAIIIFAVAFRSIVIPQGGEA